MRGLLAILLLTGCAAPHRAATATHEHREFNGRVDGLVSEDVWRDSERGGGIFFLSTSDVQLLSATHTNQTALGGGSFFTAGPMSVKVDPQTSQIIEATGSAAGAVIGTALKTAVKP